MFVCQSKEINIRFFLRWLASVYNPLTTQIFFNKYIYMCQVNEHSVCHCNLTKSERLLIDKFTITICKKSKNESFLYFVRECNLYYLFILLFGILLYSLSIGLLIKKKILETNIMIMFHVSFGLVRSLDCVI